MPGFHNPLVIPRASLSPDAVPFSMYLNPDKPLVAFWIILALPPVMMGLDAGRTLRATPGAAAVRCVPDAGAGAGHGRLGPQMAGQRLAVAGQQCLAGDAGGRSAFRGYIQERLGRLWRARRWAPMPHCCAAALFGLAHAGGWQWMLLAGLAGPPGLPPRRLAAAVLAHLALNTAHFGLYTYPMRAAFRTRAGRGRAHARPRARPQASAG